MGNLIRRILISLATLAIITESGLATEHTVGAPDGGWDDLTSLQAWASSKTFIIGDILVFLYGPAHDVLEVTKADYESCNPDNAVSVNAGGLSTIQLSTPGKKYFICGTIGHCALGMKLEINVLTSAVPPPPPSPPAIPLTPQKSSAPTPTPSWTNAPEPVSSPVWSPSYSPAPHNAPNKAPSPAADTPTADPPTEADLEPIEAPTPSPTPAEFPPSPSAGTILDVLTASTMGSIFAITMLLIP